MELVAVYGSLKRGFGNHSVMKDAESKFIDTGITLDKFIMDGHWYPYITEQEKVAPVMVEVYKVKHLDVLDNLEGHPTFYKREKRKIRLSNGKVIDAWIYIYQSDITSDFSLLENDIWVWREKDEI